MAVASPQIPAAAPRRPTRLVYDRRYGWIVDEWTDPSEEALAGGRGVFCILPIVKRAVEATSKSVDVASQTVARILENPDQISFESLKSNLNEFQKRVGLTRFSRPKPKSSTQLPPPSS